jgi:hypothetical protein
MSGLVSWFAERVVDLFGGLLAFLASSIFVSPDVTVVPQVQSIADKSALVVGACVILAIIAVGTAAMVGDSVEVRYGIKELLPRLVVGFVLSAFAIPLTGVLIDIANALTVSIAGTSASGQRTSCGSPPTQVVGGCIYVVAGDDAAVRTRCRAGARAISHQT